MSKYVKRGRPKKSVVRPKITRMSELIILNKKLKKETIEYRNQIKKFIQEKEEYMNEKNLLLKKVEFLEKELNIVEKSNNEFEIKLININKIINNCDNDNVIDGNQENDNNSIKITKIIIIMRVIITTVIIISMKILFTRRILIVSIILMLMMIITTLLIIISILFTLSIIKRPIMLATIHFPSIILHPTTTIISFKNSIQHHDFSQTSYSLCSFYCSTKFPQSQYFQPQ